MKSISKCSGSLLGCIRLSVKEIQVDIEEREAHYERTLDAWNNEKDFMDEYIVSCEKKWYMSPFELTVCSFYH